MMIKNKKCLNTALLCAIVIAGGANSFNKEFGFFSVAQAQEIDQTDPGGYFRSSLNHIKEYPVFEDSFLMQKVYDCELNPYILFTPVHDETNINRRINWSIKVIFKPNNTIKVDAVGITKIGKFNDRLTKNAKVSKAMIRACDYLINRNILELPTIIAASEDNKKFSIYFERIPAMPGGHCSVELTRNLKKITYYGGL